MNKLFEPGSRLLALFLFLPITPSIAAKTVFIQSLILEGNQELSSLPRKSTE